MNCVPQERYYEILKLLVPVNVTLFGMGLWRHNLKRGRIGLWRALNPLTGVLIRNSRVEGHVKTVTEIRVKITSNHQKLGQAREVLPLSL